jgi:large subunit ribosomal protein L5
MLSRFTEVYAKEAVPKLMEQFKYTNIHQVPKFEKVVINRGLGEAAQNAKSLEASLIEIATIAGQKPVVTRAKKAIAGFKMNNFLDRLINFSLPRIRDFRGVSPKSFDGRGNYTLGVREQLIFPEISYDSIEQIRGLDISIITTANTDEEGRALLKAVGMPFRES